jgi:lipoate-protein ligase A
MRCRIFLFESADGPSNMALDEALLDAAAADPSFAALRTYGWSLPTLSLGYFQKIGEAEADPRWGGVPIVRRPTGGGAIWHHHEVTYALVLPSTHPLARQRVDLYHRVHDAIAETLRAQGVEARRRGSASHPTGEGRPFLCFTDHDPEDIVSRGVKIVGSAQRRRSNAILQQGSLLLERSPTTPGLPGAVDLAPTASPEPRQWSLMMGDQLPAALGLVPSIEPLPAAIRLRGAELEREVYRNDSWNRKR